MKLVRQQQNQMELMQQLDDDALMFEIGRGNTFAGHALVARHLSYVVKICRAKLGREAEAEEAAQDVFASVWKNAGNWQPGAAKVTTWLYRVASNRCIDILRRRKPDVPLEAAGDPADETVDMDRLQQASDQNRLIRKALAQLSDDQKQAIELVYYRDMRQTEAAEMMNVSLAALESVLRRARQKLHSELAKYRVQLEMI
ncbi:sigma-70 family RNA polymerase sigma factor [Alphaproteobacteria bacterium]|nr:sigma-70 family RNA polymerase sigma factor [Alphaproteobacteria bacterium]MDC0147975.1 sigma-70 family RNA polymerase sigma factor [Alphaproteobacteria bacterium]